jgi:hypothetical protein
VVPALLSCAVPVKQRDADQVPLRETQEARAKAERRVAKAEAAVAAAPEVPAARSIFDAIGLKCEPVNGVGAHPRWGVSAGQTALASLASLPLRIELLRARARVRYSTG